LDPKTLAALEQTQWDIRLNNLSNTFKAIDNPSKITDSKYHPPCSKGVYDCENCKRADKAQCKRDVYFCRDDLTCQRYNLNDYHCSHGGGPACNLWRRKSNLMIETGGL
jgi:hypothetical protein